MVSYISTRLALWLVVICVGQLLCYQSASHGLKKSAHKAKKTNVQVAKISIEKPTEAREVFHSELPVAKVSIEKPVEAREVFHSELHDHRQALKIKIDTNSQFSINIIMTGMGFDFTGGPLSIMHFANEMISRGIHVRWINPIGNGISINEMREHLLKYHSLQLFQERAEFIFGSQTIECSPYDIFMATIYFTAQKAAATIAKYPFIQRNFIYFIQDYEPIFFPKGHNFMEAIESYHFPHFAIYSTNFLEQYFLKMCVGQCEFGLRERDTYSFAAKPAMKKWPVIDAKVIEDPNRKSKIVVYARKHSDRNAFDLTLLSLSKAICEDVFPGDWEFIGLGAVSRVIMEIGGECNKTVPFTIYKNIPEPEYLELIRTADIGFGLMISPHPSLPPLDFSAAGLVSVTNVFATKTQADFDRISTNFITTQPFLPDIVNGLKRAVALARNAEYRIAGAKNFQWEHAWNGPSCYGETLFEKIKMWMKTYEPLWSHPAI
jgi:hypothetical protein